MFFSELFPSSFNKGSFSEGSTSVLLRNDSISAERAEGERDQVLLRDRSGGGEKDGPRVQDDSCDILSTEREVFHFLFWLWKV